MSPTTSNPVFRISMLIGAYFLTCISGTIRPPKMHRRNSEGEPLSLRSRVRLTRTCPQGGGGALVIGSENTQLLHLMNECGSLQTEFGSRSFSTADYPANRFKSVQNQNPFRVLQSSC